jgi:tRNA threonylcarbamoyladenosine biosynthesis protein TsaB
MLAAIETTGDTCGVALYEGDALCVELHVDIPRSHDRLLAMLFQEALTIASIKPRDLEAIAVSVGPGSFTGIRIGLSFAVGVALATGIGLVPVPTLDAIAYNVCDLGKVGHRSRVLSLIPAGRLGLYASLYQIQPEFRRLTESKTIPADQVPPLLDENVFAAGPGSRLVDQRHADAIAIDSETLTAQAVGKRGLAIFRSRGTVPVSDIEPLYISSFTPVQA